MNESWKPLGDPWTLRKGMHLSMTLASIGMCSQIWIPGTAVSIGWNGPRMPLGASIFRSYMSWCGGAPGM